MASQTGAQLPDNGVVDRLAWTYLVNPIAVLANGQPAGNSRPAQYHDLPRPSPGLWTKPRPGSHLNIGVRCY